MTESLLHELRARHRLMEIAGSTSRTRGPRERIGLDPDSPWFPEHQARYHFAAGCIRHRQVLDIACGTGLGHTILHDAGARSVVGIDLSFEALQHARKVGNRSVFCQANAEAIPLQSSSVEAVVTFETLEHLKHPDMFAQEIRRILVPDGVLLLSTPNALFTKPRDGIPANPFHVREYTPDELSCFLENYFRIDELMVQRVDPAFGHSPYWSLPAWLPRNPSGRLQTFAWKVQNRLPLKVKNGISEALHGRPFYPGAKDFVFTSSSLDRGHVLMARCSL